MTAYMHITRRATTQERFERFVALHPGVYAEFCEIARDLLDRGAQHFSGRMIISVMRYQAVMAGRGQPECDNDYIGWMARRLAAEDSRFSNFFEIRKMRNA